MKISLWPSPEIVEPRYIPRTLASRANTEAGRNKREPGKRAVARMRRILPPFPSVIMFPARR